METLILEKYYKELTVTGTKLPAFNQQFSMNQTQVAYSAVIMN